MSKLIFNLTKIPEEESSKEIKLAPNDLDLSPYRFEGGDIQIHFYRSSEFIQTDYLVQADVELICDRSLEPFIYPVAASYEVIFKTDVQQETESEDTAVRRFDFTTNTFSIEKEVRDSVMLEIPMQKIHPKYLDDEGKITDFETRRFGAEQKLENQPSDPRWKKLKQLKNKAES
jgi:uncharacterized metal-binding protein YceD (DUF177 family)